MTIGEIKLDALVLMNVCNENQFDLENFTLYLNEPKYRKYLINMDKSILRAVDIINSRHILPENTVLLDDLDYTKSGNLITVYTSQIPDYEKVKKVIHITDTVTELITHSFSEKLIIEKRGETDNIIIIYYPKIVITDTSYSYNIDIPDKLARLIPYYIKYDLYQEDEPNLSYLAKNHFDSMLDSFSEANESMVTSIERIFEV